MQKCLRFACGRVTESQRAGQSGAHGEAVFKGHHTSFTLYIAHHISEHSPAEAICPFFLLNIPLPRLWGSSAEFLQAAGGDDSWNPTIQSLPSAEGTLAKATAMV